MADFFSYVDTALRIISINKLSEATKESSDDIKKKLEETRHSRYARQDTLAAILKFELQNSLSLRTVLDHEIHHYFQTLFYPFLYYLCWLEFDNLGYLRAALRDSDEPDLPISSLTLPGDFRENFRFTSLRVHLFWKGDLLMVKKIDENSPSSEIFSLNDLLEDATTIYQYKISVEHPDYLGCYDWIMDPNRTCYRRLYRFLQRKIGKKRTYDLLPMLVQLSFFSTEPFSMFCNALSMTNYHFADYENYSTKENFDRIFFAIRSKIGHWSHELLDYAFIGDLPVKTFDHQSLREIIDSDLEKKGEMHFPLVLHAKKFIDKLNIDEDLLFDLIDSTSAKNKKLLESFEPMAIHFHFMERKGRDSIILVGKDYRDAISPQGIGYDAYIKEVIKLKETTHYLFTKSHDVLQSNCHHLFCEYYELGLCKKWNSIPIVHNTCGFPHWFSWVYLRKINIAKRSLEKINRKEADLGWRNYSENSFQSRSFNYIINGTDITLSLSKEEFDDKASANLFENFLNYLKEKYNKKISDICGRISLVIHGYDYDKREVFDIPEARLWLQSTIINFPDFLCYIDFNAPIQHQVFLRASLVKHQKRIGADNMILFRYDPVDSEKFRLQQSSIFYNFGIINANVDKKILFGNLQTLLYGY